jgi:dTDP-4-amino-4,6-dideoxygalactose transaminase
MPGPGIELVGAEEMAEVLEVMQSGFLSRYGPADNPAFLAKTHRLEVEMAEYLGTRHALALSGGGSAALLIAMLALGIGPGDEVIVPGFTYVASISSIVYAGATPVLAEIDDTFTLDPADVEARITPRTRAIMVVHMLGGTGQLDELVAIAERHGLALIEDCAQAFGATYQGQRVGGIGTIGTFSFNEYKTITCGDGGMIATNDTELYERAFAMHDQGHAPYRLEAKYAPRPFLGLNFRTTELSSAVLLAQLPKSERIVAHLRANKAIVKDALAGIPGIAFRRLVDREGDIATHLVVTLPTADVARAVAAELGSCQLSESGWHVYSHMNHLLDQRTATNKGCPFHCGHSDHARPSYQPGMLPQSDDLLERSLSIGIGVRDGNLAPYGLRMRNSAEDAAEVATHVRTVIERHIGMADTDVGGASGVRR